MTGAAVPFFLGMGGLSILVGAGLPDFGAGLLSFWVVVGAGVPCWEDGVSEGAFLLRPSLLIFSEILIGTDPGPMS